MFESAAKKILPVALALALTTAAMFSRAAWGDFVQFDDDVYVTANDQVRAGLTREGMRWACADHAGNWHPLTWLSHMLDVEIFGMKPGGHHAVSILLHATDAVLLFLALLALTGRLWPCAAVAGLFALHPLRVESVAWVAERKDVLSALFWFLTTLAYTRFVRKPGVVRYLLVAVLFSLGLASKPMVVTLPLVLLLLDYWPLDRFRGPEAVVSAWGAGRPRHPALRLLLEKLPLLALSAASAVVTYLAQSRGGAVVKELHAPLVQRVGNAVISYCRYMAKTIWPESLSAFYPYPAEDPPALLILGAAAFILVVTIACVYARSTRPWFPVGWLWFVGTLVPVIGVVQVGGQAMADRYTYLPQVGLLVAAVWSIAGMQPPRRLRTISLPLALGAALAILSAMSWMQIAAWKSTVALFSHAVAVTDDNELANLNLGAALFDAGRTDEAIERFREVLRINPRAPDGHHNLGAALFKLGRTDEALEHFRTAIRICPDFADPYDYIGLALITAGRRPEAAPYLEMAERLRKSGVRRCSGL